MLYTQAYIMKHYTLKPHNFEPVYWNCIVCEFREATQDKFVYSLPTHNASFK